MSTLIYSLSGSIFCLAGMLLPVSYTHLDVYKRQLLTFLCVRFWELGLRAVWYCMIADNVVKALLFAVPALRFLFPGKPRSEKA